MKRQILPYVFLCCGIPQVASLSLSDTKHPAPSVARNPSQIRPFSTEDSPARRPSLRAEKRRLQRKQTTSLNSSQQRRKESLRVGNNPLLSLNLNLDALARAQAADRAQELYQRIAALHEEGYYAVAPDTVSFNSVLKAWQNDVHGALKFWESQFSPQGTPFASQGTSSHTTMQPNTRSYNILLLALAKAGRAAHSEIVLRYMQEPDPAFILPDTVTYNTVLLAYAVTGCLALESDTAVRAERLLQEMINSTYLAPDAVSYNTVIAAWAAAHPNRHGAEQAERWLRRMTNDVSIGKSTTIEPDVYTYTTVIQAWARVGDVSRAQALLDEMPVRGLHPNRITYTALLQAYCAQGQVDQAEQVLEIMKLSTHIGALTRPDNVAYSVLLDGWATVADRRPEETVTAVTRLLEEMQHSSRLSLDWPDTTPTAQTYTSVLHALARTRIAASICERILRQDMPRQGIQPNAIHCNTVLDALAKSPRADKTLCALKLWEEEMEHKGVEPDIISYNSVLASAANAFGKPAVKTESLRIALYLFTQLKHKTSAVLAPTSLTYYYLFKAIRRLSLNDSVERRSTLLSQVFRLCCADGCLNNVIWEQIVLHVLENEWRGWLGVNARDTTLVRVQDLPAAWSRRGMKHRHRTPN